MFKKFFFLGILIPYMVYGEASTDGAETVLHGGASDTVTYQAQTTVSALPPILINPYAGRSGVLGFTGKMFQTFFLDRSNSREIQLNLGIHEIAVKDDGDCTLYALGISRSEFIDSVVDAIQKTQNQQELEGILTKTQELVFNGTSVSFFSMGDSRLRADTMVILKDLVVNPEHPSSQTALAPGYDGKSTSTVSFSEIQFNFDFSNKDTIVTFIRSLYSRTSPTRNIPMLLLGHVPNLKNIRFRTWMLDRGAQVPPFIDPKQWKAIYNPRESTAKVGDQSPGIIDMISISNHTNLGLVERF